LPAFEEGMMRRSAVVACALATALAGCSDVSTRSRWAGSTAAAVGSSGVVAGSTSPALLDLEVLSPRPASWLATPDVTVSGVVRAPDPTKVRQVTVNGVAATVGGAGDFQANVRLDPGIARVVVLVTDVTGNVTATTASYAVGPTRPFTDRVEDAIAARLDAGSFWVADRAIAGALDKIDWNAKLVPLSPISLGNLGGLVPADLDIVSVARPGPWTATLTPRSGALDVTAEVSNVEVTVDVHTPASAGFGVSVCGQVTAQLARATTTAQFVPVANGPVSLAIARPVVDLRGATFTVRGPLQGPIASAALSLLQQQLTAAIESAIADILERDLAKVLQGELAKVTSPSPVSVGGATFTISGEPSGLDLDPTGAVLAARVDVVAPVGSGVTPPPGWLSGAGPAPLLGPGRALAISISPELFSKATAVAWQSGAMDVDVDGKAWAGLAPGLPPLDVQGFSRIVPELATVLGPATPLVLRVRPALPPRIAIAPGPTLATLEIGELHLEVLADLGNGTLVPALDLTVHGSVPLDPALSSTKLAFSTGPIRPRWFFSVVGQPLVHVDAVGLQTRLTVVADALLPTMLATVPVSLPPICGKAIKNVRLTAEGPLGDHLTVSGDL
jgi:hypothetical protein